MVSSVITGLDLDQQLPSLKLGRPRESRFEVKSRRVVHLLRRQEAKWGAGVECACIHQQRVYSFGSAFRTLSIFSKGGSS